MCVTYFFPILVWVGIGRHYWKLMSECNCSLLAECLYLIITVLHHSSLSWDTNTEYCTNQTNIFYVALEYEYIRIAGNIFRYTNIFTSE